MYVIVRRKVNSTKPAIYAIARPTVYHFILGKQEYSTSPPIYTLVIEKVLKVEEVEPVKGRILQAIIAYLHMDVNLGP